MNLPFDEWLPQQRWYAGRGRELASVAARCRGRRCATTSTWCCSTSTTPTAPPERYQVMVRWDTGPDRASTADVATIGADGRPHGLRRALRPGGRAIPAVADRSVGDSRSRPVRFVKEPGATLPLDAAPRVIGAEQSNTSVVFEDDGRLQGVPPRHPGHQPRHRAQPGVGPGGQPARGAAARIASRRRSTASPTRSGMVTEFAANSAEGWDMATASTRDLFAEGDLYADEVGGDFAGESYRLGEAVASVHAHAGRRSSARRRACSRSTRCWSGCTRSPPRCPKWSSTCR